MTLRAEIARAADRLAAAGVESARVDAELLAAYVLGVPRGRLLVAGPFTDAQRSRFADLVSARTRRVPLQHLTGTAAFRHVELAVGPGVFVPRPETELLAGWGIDRARTVTGHRPVVVDLCSGSGAIAVAVAEELPTARVLAVELSLDALEWLRRNASGRSVQVVAADATDPHLLSDLDGQVDVLLCNPPYVPDGTVVAPEVAGDPAEAVFGGPDGLAVIRPVASAAARLLRPGGWLGVEHDERSAPAVADILRAAHLTAVRTHPDLTARPRFTTAQQSPSPPSAPIP